MLLNTITVIILRGEMGYSLSDTKSKHITPIHGRHGRHSVREAFPRPINE